MGFDDKLDDAKGQAKEAFGKATDNEDLEAEGKADQIGASIGEAGDKIKDAASTIKDKFTN